MDLEADRTLLIIEDDATLAKALADAFERRGYRTRIAGSVKDAERHLKTGCPSHAVVDLKLGDGSGLVCVQRLRALSPAARIVVLTGYASIVTAIEAIKLGATHYLSKPADVDEIERAFAMGEGSVDVPIGPGSPSLKSWEWERIQETLAAADFNISETARRLGMHRRTLARKLKRHPPSPHAQK